MDRCYFILGNVNAYIQLALDVNYKMGHSVLGTTVPEKDL